MFGKARYRRRPDAGSLWGSAHRRGRRPTFARWRKDSANVSVKGATFKRDAAPLSLGLPWLVARESNHEHDRPRLHNARSSSTRGICNRAGLIAANGSAITLLPRAQY
jgi:hypothetical protein